MALGETLTDLRSGDRVRVLGWIDETDTQLDAVATVSDFEYRPATDDAEVSAPGSVSVTLEAVGGCTADFDDVLPDAVATDEYLELFAIERVDETWDAVEIWIRDPSTGSFETVGTAQHLAQVNDRG